MNSGMIKQFILCFFNTPQQSFCYPEYEYIKDRQPFISDKNGRLYFNMKRIIAGEWQ